jgi:hypothetical protein
METLIDVARRLRSDPAALRRAIVESSRRALLTARRE